MEEEILRLKTENTRLCAEITKACQVRIENRTLVEENRRLRHLVSLVEKAMASKAQWQRDERLLEEYFTRKGG